jgi:hypothetical protein
VIDEQFAIIESPGALEITISGVGTTVDVVQQAS